MAKDLMFQKKLGQIFPIEELRSFPLPGPKRMGILDMITLVIQSKEPES
jgi:hypothetical protein